MSDSDKASTDAPSCEPEKPLRDQDGKWLRGYSANPRGLTARGASLLSALKRRLAANPDPETGEGKLAGQLVEMYLQVLKEAATDRDPDRAQARQVFLQAFAVLMNRVDPPKSKLEIDVVRRLIIQGPKLPKLTDARLIDFTVAKEKEIQRNGNGHPALPERE